MQLYWAGFNIVTQKVFKLSSETTSASDTIESSLSRINNNLEILKQRIGQINSATNEQAQLVQDFSEIIEELSNLSVEMKIFTTNKTKSVLDIWDWLRFMIGGAELSLWTLICFTECWITTLNADLFRWVLNYLSERWFIAPSAELPRILGFPYSFAN